MQEFIGLAYFAEIPSVFWDVTVLGLPQVCPPAPNNPISPCSTREATATPNTSCSSRHGGGVLRIRLARLRLCRTLPNADFRYERPRLGDEPLGLRRLHLSGPTDGPRKGGREQDVFDAFETFGRYLDVDGDGIPYRTLPGSGMDPILYRGRDTTPWAFIRKSPKTTTISCSDCAPRLTTLETSFLRRFCERKKSARLASSSSEAWRIPSKKLTISSKKPA